MGKKYKNMHTCKEDDKQFWITKYGYENWDTTHDLNLGMWHCTFHEEVRVCIDQSYTECHYETVEFSSKAFFWLIVMYIRGLICVQINRFLKMLS